MIKDVNFRPNDLLDDLRRATAFRMLSDEMCSEHPQWNEDHKRCKPGYSSLNASVILSKLFILDLKRYSLGHG